MEKIKLLLYRFFVLVLVFGLCSLWSAAAIADLVSKPGEYSGYAEPIYEMAVRSSVHVPGHDGTLLAVDIHRPSNDGLEPVSEPLPAILVSHPAFSRRYLTLGQDLIPFGYVIAALDLRGMGASFGQRHGDFNVDERLDLKAVIEWIAAQSWCDGHVGMIGGSYLGTSQHMAASTQPPHLKAIVPSVAAYDTYQQFYPNGVAALPTLGPPPISLSGIPVDEDIPPDYPLLEAAILSHYGSTGEMDWRVPGMFRDAWSDDTQNMPLIDHSPQTYCNEIETAGVNTYEFAGWYDHHVDEQLVAFKALGNKITIGPWPHRITDPILTIEQMRWLDYSLKGIDNGILDEPPVYYFTVNAPADEEWRFAWDWPLPNQEMKSLYFAEGISGTVASVNDGSLSVSAPTSVNAWDDYIVDYDITVFDGLYRRDRRNFAGDMTPSPDEKGLTYTSPPLKSDMEVTGHPVVHIWVTSTAPDGYFLVYLEEVDESGFSHYVTDGVMRGSSREVFHDSPQAAQWNAVGIPYHRSFAEDYAPLSEQPVELTFELFPTSYVFRAGNRIRVTITCAEQNTYQYPESMIFDPPPVVSIYRNKIYKSYISLPNTTKPITAKVRITPKTLNLKSKGRFMAIITPPRKLPKGYSAEDIDISTVTCGGAPAVWGKVIHGKLIAKFNREDLVDIPTGHKITLTVKGEFNYEIPFEGSDRIRVIE